ncbi:MAG: putative restriction endonuclease-like, partial [Hyphomonadaceae bacterium]
MRNAKTQKFARSLRNSPTKAETILWKILRNLNIEKVKFRRQHPIPPYITDFAALEIKLIIEVDGATHSTEA